MHQIYFIIVLLDRFSGHRLKFVIFDAFRTPLVMSLNLFVSVANNPSMTFLRAVSKLPCTTLSVTSFQVPSCRH